MPYCVRLRFDGRTVGAGFFVTSRWILTAAHCLRSIPSGVDHIGAYDDDGNEVDLRIVERNNKVDLALLEPVRGKFERRIPDADRCLTGDPWTSPYRPSATEPTLSGEVTRHDFAYECEGGDLIKALQLRATTELGDYSGYSGSPVEHRPTRDDSRLVGIMLEQYPDRAEPERASNVLFAGAIGDALGTFPQFDVGHLMNVLTVEDRTAEVTSMDETSIPAAMAISHGDAKLEFLERCAARGYLEADELRQLRLKVIESVIETGVE